MYGKAANFARDYEFDPDAMIAATAAVLAEFASGDHAGTIRGAMDVVARWARREATAAEVADAGRALESVSCEWGQKLCRAVPDACSWLRGPNPSALSVVWGVPPGADVAPHALPGFYAVQCIGALDDLIYDVDRRRGAALHERLACERAERVGRAFRAAHAKFVGV